MTKLAAHEVKPPLQNRPGVGVARWRCDDTYCLPAKNHEPHFWTRSSTMEPAVVGRVYCDGHAGIGQ